MARRSFFLFALLCCFSGAVGAQSTGGGTETRVPVIFSGGHETDPRDRARPVVLIAAALKVTPEVFARPSARSGPPGRGSSRSPIRCEKTR